MFLFATNSQFNSEHGDALLIVPDQSDKIRTRTQLTAGKSQPSEMPYSGSNFDFKYEIRLSAVSSDPVARSTSSALL
jgi:hypothetical protein